MIKNYITDGIDSIALRIAKDSAEGISDQSICKRYGVKPSEIKKAKDEAVLLASRTLPQHHYETMIKSLFDHVKARREILVAKVLKKHLDRNAGDIIAISVGDFNDLHHRGFVTKACADDGYDNADISCLNLETRAYRVLDEQGIKKVSQLKDAIKTGNMSTYGIGKKSICQIHDAVHQFELQSHK